MSKKSHKRQLFVPPLPKTPTIFHQWVSEKLLLEALPKDKKFCKVISKNVQNLSGPFGEEPDDPKFSRAYGSSFSLYPMYEGAIFDLVFAANVYKYIYIYIYIYK